MPTTDSIPILTVAVELVTTISILIVSIVIGIVWPAKLAILIRGTAFKPCGGRCGAGSRSCLACQFHSVWEHQAVPDELESIWKTDSLEMQSYRSRSEEGLVALDPFDVF